MEYSLMALKHILDKKSGELTSAREISSQYSIPLDTTAKILQKLTSTSVLVSLQGPKGGYSFNKSVNEVSYLDIFQIIEGKSEVVDCEPCQINSTCNISTPLKNLNKYLIQYFNGLTLRELFDETVFSQFNLNQPNEFNKDPHESTR
jgi:Rrf2 family protein